MEVGAGWKRGLVVVWEELLGQEWEQAVLVVLAVLFFSCHQVYNITKCR
jgi:uncharacterized membrane protein YdfJ with MMPL/SSD domain